MHKLRFAAGALLPALVFTSLFSGPAAPVLAQAPAPDAYEENDSLTQAALVPLGAELGNLSISPAADPDWFRLLLRPPAGTPGSYRVEVVGAPGLDLTLKLYDPNAALAQVHNDPAGPNAALSFSVTSEGYYALEVSSATGAEGWYLLRVLDLTPTPTPLPGPTSTAAPTLTPSPTAILPTLTPVPTANQGAAPDFAEPNYDFETAYRIAPGNTLTGLNFNPGLPGAVDNDFFVMAVRAGVRYRCETGELGPGVDTNLIAYADASFEALIGGNDDLDTQAGLIQSALSFTAGAEGDIYLLVGYKYSQPGLRLPGDASYSLTCQAAAPTPTSAPQVAGGPALPASVQALSITLLSRPAALPTLSATALVPQPIDVLVGYDRNANGEIEANEGVAGLSVRVIEVRSNRELTQGFTDASGALRFTLASASPLRLAIPFLGATQEVRPGSPAQWTLLIPAATAPGLIP